MNGTEIASAIDRFINNECDPLSPGKFEGPLGYWFQEEAKNQGYTEPGELEFIVCTHVDEASCIEFDDDADLGSEFIGCPFVPHSVECVISPTQIFDLLHRTLPEYGEGIVTWRRKPEKADIRIPEDDLLDRIIAEPECKGCLQRGHFPPERVYTRIYYAWR